MQPHPVQCLQQWRWTANMIQRTGLEIECKYIQRLDRLNTEPAMLSNIQMAFSNRTGTLVNAREISTPTIRFLFTLNGWIGFRSMDHTNQDGQNNWNDSAPMSKILYNIWYRCKGQQLLEVMRMLCSKNNKKVCWKVQFSQSIVCKRSPNGLLQKNTKCV